jgi:hypothetical protein
MRGTAAAFQLMRAADEAALLSVNCIVLVFQPLAAKGMIEISMIVTCAGNQ